MIILTFAEERKLLGQGIPFRFRHLFPVFKSIGSPFTRPVRAGNLSSRERIKDALRLQDNITPVQLVADLAPEHPVLRLHSSTNYIAALVLKAQRGHLDLH